MTEALKKIEAAISHISVLEAERDGLKANSLEEYPENVSPLARPIAVNFPEPLIESAQIIAKVRADALEEAAKVAEAVQFPEASKCLPTPRRGFELAQRKIAAAILALKDSPNG